MMRTVLTVFAAVSAAGVALEATAEELIWPNDIRRVDPTKQTYERLPSRAPAPTIAGQESGSFRPVGFFRILDGTSFHYRGERYRLEGVAPIPNGRICVRDDGTRWACGLAARNELIRMIKALGIRCVPLAKGAMEVEVRCGNDAYDIASELVSQGLATGAPKASEARH